MGAQVYDPRKELTELRRRLELLEQAACEWPVEVHPHGLGVRITSGCIKARSSDGIYYIKDAIEIALPVSDVCHGRTDLIYFYNGTVTVAFGRPQGMAAPPTIPAGAEFIAYVLVQPLAVTVEAHNISTNPKLYPLWK